MCVKILVTGGAGFIGSHTVDALIARGHSVRVLDCLDPQIHGSSDAFPDYANPAAEWFKGDVRDLCAVSSVLEDVDVVYHFAAHTGVGQSMYDVRKYVDTNCTGTASVLEAIVRRSPRIKRLILASSRAVYGEGTYACVAHGRVNPGLRERRRLEAGDFAPCCPICGARVEIEPTREDDATQPVSLYGWTKLQQEQLCRHVADSHDLDVVILRYFNVIGSRQSLSNPYTGIATTFYKRAMAGRLLPLYERGEPVRDFVHVDDVVAANVLALDAPPSGKGTAYNVGSGQRTTIREFAAEVVRASGRDAKLDATTLFRVGDIFACCACLERARGTLGYEPRVRLDRAVSEFAQWARACYVIDDSEEAANELARHGLLGARQPGT